MSENNPLVGKRTAGACGLQVITSPSDDLSLWLGPNERFVILMENKAPVIIGHSSPGTYDIEGADFAEEGYPVAVLGMPVENTKDFEAIPAHIVNKIIAKIRDAIADGSYELKPMTLNFKTPNDTLETFKFAGVKIDKPLPAKKKATH